MDHEVCICGECEWDRLGHLKGAIRIKALSLNKISIYTCLQWYCTEQADPPLLGSPASTSL